MSTGFANLSNEKFFPKRPSVVPRSRIYPQEQEAYGAGHAKGYHEGYTKGLADGREAGFSSGFQQGLERVANVERALDDPPPNSILEIATAVGRKHGVRLSEMRGARRTAYIVRARHEAMAMAMADGSRTSAQVADWFHKDHTTVLHAIHAHAKRLAESAIVHKRESE